MKRLEEAKKLLLGPDHESDPHLTQFFKKNTTTNNQIPPFLRETDTENEELEKDGPPEKVMKIGKP